MEPAIWIRSEGIGQSEVLEEKILELKSGFSKEGVEIYREIKKTFEYGGIGSLFITLNEDFIDMDRGTAMRLILKFFDKLFEALFQKDKYEIDVRIQMGIKGTGVIFRLPKDTEKLFNYLKKDRKIKNN